MSSYLKFDATLQQVLYNGNPAIWAASKNGKNYATVSLVKTDDPSVVRTVTLWLMVDNSIIPATHTVKSTDMPGYTWQMNAVSLPARLEVVPQGNNLNNGAG